MEFLLDVVQLVVHVLNLRDEATAVIILFAPAKLTVHLPHFVPKMSVFAPSMSIGPVTLQLILHMTQHLIEMINLGAQSVPATLPGAAVFIVAAVPITRVGVARIRIALVSLLLIDRLRVTFFVVIMRGRELIETGKAQAGQSESEKLFFHMHCCSEDRRGSVPFIHSLRRAKGVFT